MKLIMKLKNFLIESVYILNKLTVILMNFQEVRDLSLIHI